MAGHDYVIVSGRLCSCVVEVNQHIFDMDAQATCRTSTPSDEHALERGTPSGGRIYHGSSGRALGRARAWTGVFTTGRVGTLLDGRIYHGVRRLSHPPAPTDEWVWKLCSIRENAK